MTQKISFRRPHDPSVKTAIHFNAPSLTKRSMQAECDINNIMRKFQNTGLIDHQNTHQGQYGDFTSAEDYHASMTRIVEAQEMFEALPSTIRRRFHNDPAEFLEFVADAENRPEAEKLGLVPKQTQKRPDGSDKAPSDKDGSVNEAPQGEVPKQEAPKAS